MNGNSIMVKCDFCDKEAIHFCSQAISQSCQNHIEDANAVESKYYEEIEVFYKENIEQKNKL